MKYAIYITKDGSPWTTAARGANPLPVCDTVRVDGGLETQHVVASDRGRGFYVFDLEPADVDLMVLVDADPTGAAGLAPAERYVPFSVGKDDSAITLTRLLKLDSVTEERMATLDSDISGSLNELLGLSGHKNTRVVYSDLFTVDRGQRAGTQLPRKAIVYCYHSPADAASGVNPFSAVQWNFTYNAEGSATTVVSFSL